MSAQVASSRTTFLGVRLPAVDAKCSVFVPDPCHLLFDSHLHRHTVSCVVNMSFCRVLDYDLDLPQLQQLQLSGNLTLDMGLSELELSTSKLTSLSLQQTLDSMEALNLFDSQPHLQYLTVLVSGQSGQDQKCGSSVDSVRSLQQMVALVDEDPDVNEDLVFGPGSMGLADAKKALNHVLMPPGCAGQQLLGASGRCSARVDFARSCLAMWCLRAHV